MAGSQFDDAWRCIGEAITAVETTKERMWEAGVHRTAGGIALLLPERDAAKAEAYFDRALVVARAQQAKSWELRAAMISGPSGSPGQINPWGVEALLTTNGPVISRGA